MNVGPAGYLVAHALRLTGGNFALNGAMTVLNRVKRGTM